MTNEARVMKQRTTQTVARARFPGDFPASSPSPRPSPHGRGSNRFSACVRLTQHPHSRLERILTQSWWNAVELSQSWFGGSSARSAMFIVTPNIGSSSPGGAKCRYRLAQLDAAGRTNFAPPGLGAYTGQGSINIGLLRSCYAAASSIRLVQSKRQCSLGERAERGVHAEFPVATSVQTCPAKSAGAKTLFRSPTTTKVHQHTNPHRL